MATIYDEAYETALKLAREAVGSDGDKLAKADEERIADRLRDLYRLESEEIEDTLYDVEHALAG